MNEKNLMKNIYSCKKCRNLKFYKKVCKNTKPEPSLLNRKAKLLILGINPGGIVGNFDSFETYKQYYKRLDICNGSWLTGFIKTYEILFSEKGVSRKDIHIMNFIKCSSKNLKGVDEDDLINARDNCNKFLIEQLKIYSPFVILVHSKRPCRFMLELLEKNDFYKIVKYSHKIEELMKMPTKKLNGEYIIVKNRNSDKILILFLNQHLCRWHFSKKPLMEKLSLKRRLIKQIASSRK